MFREERKKTRDSVVDAGMSFDGLARWYAVLETAVFGGYLWRTRTRFLSQMAGTKRALVLGDGDGRFTAALADRAPDARIISLDSSVGMLRASRARLMAAARARVYFACADVRAMPLSAELVGSCDAVVSHFLLDCLDQHEMDALARVLAEQGRAGCVWMISEFAIPERQPWRWAGRRLIGILYWFTAKITGLAVRQVPDYAASLRRAGFEPMLLDRRLKGLLRSEVWKLADTANGHA